MAYNYFKGIPELPEYAREKQKRPKLIAVVDEIIVQAVKLVFLSVQWTVSNLFQMKNTNFLLSHQFKYGTMSVPAVKYVQESAQR